MLKYLKKSPQSLIHVAPKRARHAALDLSLALDSELDLDLDLASRSGTQAKRRPRGHLAHSAAHHHSGARAKGRNLERKARRPAGAKLVGLVCKRTRLVGDKYFPVGPTIGRPNDDYQFKIIIVLRSPPIQRPPLAGGRRKANPPTLWGRA